MSEEALNIILSSLFTVRWDGQCSSNAPVYHQFGVDPQVEQQVHRSDSANRRRRNSDRVALVRYVRLSAAVTRVSFSNFGFGWAC